MGGVLIAAGNQGYRETSRCKSAYHFAALCKFASLNRQIFFKNMRSAIRQIDQHVPTLDISTVKSSLEYSDKLMNQ